MRLTDPPWVPRSAASANTTAGGEDPVASYTPRPGHPRAHYNSNTSPLLTQVSVPSIVNSTVRKIHYSDTTGALQVYYRRTAGALAIWHRRLLMLP